MKQKQNNSMIINLERIFQADYEYAENRGSKTDTCARPSQSMLKVITPKQFESEIKALSNYAGVKSLCPGMTIKMSLQEINSIIPKKRVRIESYKQLMKFLNDELRISLELTSRKTK